MNGGGAEKIRREKKRKAKNKKGRERRKKSREKKGETEEMGEGRVKGRQETKKVRK